ncbi:MAG: hypothetical protein ACLQUT_06415 [Thermoleophilia bacterium]
MTARYRMPVCAVSEDDDLRISNADLPRFTALELWAEGERVRAALAQVTAEYSSGRHLLPAVYGDGWRLDGREWLERRLRAVRAERSHRKGARNGLRHSTTRTPPQALAMTLASE